MRLVVPLLIMLSAAPAYAWVSPAPDVVVDCEPSLAPTLRRLAAADHIPVHVFTGPDSRLFGLIRHRARADIVVAAATLLDRLASARLIAPSPRPVLGTDRYVLIAGAATAPTHAVVTDPTEAATFDGQALLHQIAIPLPAPPIGVPTTQAVLRAVGDTPGLVGLVQESDAHSTDAVRILPQAVPVPAPEIEAALTTNGQSRNAADFLAFIASADSRPAWRAAGLRPAP